MVTFLGCLLPGLSYDTNESVLKDAFKDYGEVVEGRRNYNITTLST